MSHPDVITTIWDDPRNVETLSRLFAEGKSFAQIAAEIGQGATRNACIGKAKRMNLQRPERRGKNRAEAFRTVNGEVPRKGNTGNPGQPKAHTIAHRVNGRLKAERARQEGKLSHRGHEAFRAPGRVDVDDDGVDVSHLIAFADRRIGKECAWIPGDPLEGAMCCGKPVKEGTQWCAEHLARVYAGRAALA